MAEATSLGPEVADTESLYRAITSGDWWVAAEGRVSSAAFSFPVFSADVASLTSVEETLSRFRPGTGLVRFNAGAARRLAFDARLEIDERFPGHLAHANVYCALARNERKRKAQQLVGMTQVVKAPSFS